MAKWVTIFESDGVTAASDSYDQGAVVDGATSTPLRRWWRNDSDGAEVLASTRFRRVALGTNDGLSMLQIAADVPLTPPTAPTLAPAAGTELEVGTYKYAITFVTANGETSAGTEETVVTTGGNEQVSLSAIPTGPAGTTQRKIYRTAVGGTQKKLVATLPNNTATTYLDAIPDASLGANVPTLNTSGSADTWGTANVNIGSLAVGAYAAIWMRYNVPASTTEVGNPRWAYVYFEEA